MEAKQDKKFGRMGIVFGTIAIVGLAALLMMAAHASADELLQIPQNRDNGGNIGTLDVTATGLQSQSNKLAADWLMSNQFSNGSFPWTTGGKVYYNVQGPPGRGLLKAYEITNDEAYLNSAILLGDWMINTMYAPNTGLNLYSDGDPRFATYDPLFLEELSQVTGNTSYADFVQTWFWDKLASGTYGESNDMNASEFGHYIVDARNGQGIVALSPWDIAGAAVGAYVAGETAIANDLMDSILYGLNQTTTSDVWYDSTGLAGAVWASAITGFDLDPTTGAFASCDSTADLAALLADMRTDDAPKGWLWSSAADPSDYSNGDTQATAFAIMALDAFDRTTYDGYVTEGVAFLRNLQQTSGEYLEYPTASPGIGGNVEVNGEAISAIVTVSPSNVYVDDDWIGSSPGDSVSGHVYGYDAFSTIVDGVDAVSDSTVHVAAGTYTESVTINKSIDLVGQPGAIIKCPATPKTVKVQESGHTFEYVVLAAGGTYGSGNNTYYGTGTINIGITGFEIDGNNGGTSSSYYFTGILLRNAVGNISDNYIHDMYGPSGNGSGEQTFGMLIYGNSDATVYGNTVENFSRGGIVANGEAGLLADPVVDIKNNIVYGNGLEDATGWWAENGIQIGYGASGIVEGNEVSNCWVNSTGWASTGVMVVDTSFVTIDGNHVYNNYQAIGVVDFSAAYGHPWNVLVVENVTVSNNTLESNEWGITVNNDARNITILYNNILNTAGDAIDVWNYGYGDPSPTNVTIHYNNIYNNGWGLWTDNNQIDTVNATLNWWGNAVGPYNATMNPCSTGDGVEGNVKFIPWLDAPYPSGSARSFNVFIDSNGNGVFDAGESSFNCIQSAIDAASDGDTIIVAAGTYTESIIINKSIDLVGQPGAIIKCPATPKTVKVQESGHTFEYVVLAAGGTYGSGNNTYYGTGTINIGITGFEIDGNNGGTSSSYYFTGILLRNAVGNISDNYIHDMYGPSGNGSGEQTFGMLIYGNSDATVYGNTVENFSRGGIVANGDAGALPDPVANIKNNIVYGNGLESATNWNAENGIQIGYGASGTIKENEVYDCMCNNPGWASSGIIITGTVGVIVEDNDVQGNDGGITVVGYEDYKNAPCYNITIKNNQVYSNVVGIDAEANVHHIVIGSNTIYDNDYDGVYIWAYNFGWESSTPDNITIQNNSIYNHIYCGIYLSDVYDNISINQNDIYNNGEAVYLDNYYGVDSDAAIHYNNIHNNIYYGVWNNGNILVNATYNYWGNASGPHHPNNPSYLNGTGDNISGNVDFIPWLNAPYPDGKAINYWNPTSSGTGQQEINETEDADTVINITTTAPVDVTVQNYSENPAGTGLPGGVQAVGNYIDVNVSNPSAVVWPIEIRIYYTQADLDALNITEDQIIGMYYWDGSNWVLYHQTGVNTDNVGNYEGYVWAFAEDENQLSPKVIGGGDLISPTSWHTPGWIPNKHPTTGTDIKLYARDDGVSYQIHYKIDNTPERTGNINSMVDLGTFSEGRHSIEYWAVDAWNNEEIHHTVTFYVMESHPEINVAFDGVYEWAGTRWQITPDTKVFFEVSTNEFVTIHYRVDDDNWARFTEPFTLSPGTHRLYYYLTDAIGNGIVTSCVVEVGAIGEPPVTTLESNPPSPNGNNGWYTTNVHITLTVTDPDGDATVTFYRINNGEWQRYTGPFILSDDGINNIQYYSVDNAGNKESTNMHQISIDLYGPDITLNEPSNLLYIFGRAIMPLPGDKPVIIGRITISSIVEDTATSGVNSAKLYIDDELRETFDNVIDYTLDETMFGEHTIKIVAIDNAGNEAVKEVKMVIYNINILKAM